MWWGYSPPLDLRCEMMEDSSEASSTLEILIVGAGDARHITKTLASSYTHLKRTINFHAIEPTIELIARSILLLNICLENKLGMYGMINYNDIGDL